jgi:hypothetical protein
MGLIEFLFLVVIVVLIGWVAIYALDTLAPGHPAIINRIIWLVVVLIIIWTLVTATGLIAYDPPLPRFRR